MPRRLVIARRQAGLVTQSVALFSDDIAEISVFAAGQQHFGGGDRGATGGTL